MVAVSRYRYTEMKEGKSGACGVKKRVEMKKVGGERERGAGRENSPEPELHSHVAPVNPTSHLQRPVVSSQHPCTHPVTHGSHRYTRT